MKVSFEYLPCVQNVANSLVCLLQAVIQLMGAVNLVLSISNGNVPSPLAISSLATALLSLIVGELGT